MGGGLSGHCFLGKNFQEKLKGSHNHLEFIETAQTPQVPFLLSSDVPCKEQNGRNE